MAEDLRWDDLRLFLAVARGGTLAAGAAALGVNASTLHRRIASLEEVLGARLFDKQPRGYSLTGVGEALLPQAEAVEEGVQALRRTATGHDLAATGVLRITVPQDLVPVLAPHLATLVEVCPGLVPELHADERVYDLRRETDVALRMGSRPPEDAIARRLTAVAWCRYRPADAEGELPWAVYEGMDAVPAVQWRRRTLADVPVRARVGRVAAMAELLSGLRCQGLLPCYVGDARRELARVGEPLPLAATTLWLLLHVDLRRAARVRAFVDVVVPRILAQAWRFDGTAARGGGSQGSEDAVR